MTWVIQVKVASRDSNFASTIGFLICKGTSMWFDFLVLIFLPKKSCSLQYLRGLKSMLGRSLWVTSQFQYFLWFRIRRGARIHIYYTTFFYMTCFGEMRFWKLAECHFRYSRYSQKKLFFDGNSCSKILYYRTLYRRNTCFFPEKNERFGVWIGEDVQADKFCERFVSSISMRGMEPSLFYKSGGSGSETFFYFFWQTCA